MSVATHSEVRVALIRDHPSKQPVLYDLTLHGLSTSFLYAWLDDAWAYETQDAEFFADVYAPGPLTYQWWVQWPWMEEWEWRWLPGQTNSSLVLSNVDSWVGARLDAQGNLRQTLATVRVSNAVGESLWLEPAGLVVSPLLIRIPATNYGSGPGPAQRYPATIRVFDQPTNLASVTVTLWDLSHQRSADLAVLLVSPSGTNIMLMSRVGATNGVANANLIFKRWWPQPPIPGPIASGQTSIYSPSNYGGVTQMTNAPGGPYSTDFGDLVGSNPNGIWQLYIYDDSQGALGQLVGSWYLEFEFQ